MRRRERRRSVEAGHTKKYIHRRHLYTLHIHPKNNDETICLLLLAASLIFAACNNGQQATAAADTSSTTVTVDPAKDWRFGITLWTFHTVNFPLSLDKVDSVFKLTYIEPNTFTVQGLNLKTALLASFQWKALQS